MKNFSNAVWQYLQHKILCTMIYTCVCCYSNFDIIFALVLERQHYQHFIYHACNASKQFFVVFFFFKLWLWKINENPYYCWCLPLDGTPPKNRSIFVSSRWLGFSFLFMFSKSDNRNYRTAIGLWLNEAVFCYSSYAKSMSWCMEHSYVLNK